VAGGTDPDFKRWANGKDGETKTEASDGYVPLHPVLANHLQQWRCQRRTPILFFRPSRRAVASLCPLPYLYLIISGRLRKKLERRSRMARGSDFTTFVERYGSPWRLELQTSTVSTREYQLLTTYRAVGDSQVLDNTQQSDAYRVGHRVEKTTTACGTQQGRQNHPTGSPNVGRQLQNTETGYGRKVAIIRKKSCAAGCQCRYNLQRIRRLDSRCGS
jgi:hypothetical protein